MKTATYQAYHTLVVYCKVNRFWFIEFGDYSYNVVKDEARDSYPDEKTKIITTIDDQKFVDAEVNKLNNDLAKKRNEIAIKRENAQV
tara:strand:- start:644 stop:904 length:261 start_codon:yes stop_codon:yes gene_type:complete